jgi:aryl-alcohol dehydrogenase-like predicted oxidoreductase
MSELVAAGLVGHVGLSNVAGEELRRSLAVHPIAAVQVEWSMWSPVDPDLLAVARNHGVGLVAWSPLGGGFLTGSVTALGHGDFRRHAPRFSPENLEANNDRYAPVRRIAGELAVTPGQLALAWLLHQDPAVVPIPGSRTPTHIDENVAAASIDLYPETLDRINEALRDFKPEGDTLLGQMR